MGLGLSPGSQVTESNHSVMFVSTGRTLNLKYLNVSIIFINRIILIIYIEIAYVWRFFTSYQACCTAHTFKTALTSSLCRAHEQTLINIPDLGSHP